MLIFAKVVAVVFLLGSTLAHACSYPAATLTQYADRAALVMVVQVMESKFDPTTDVRRSHTPVSAKFRIVDVLKGNADPVKSLVSGLGGGDCGVGLAAGSYFLVMADHVVADLGVWLPSGSSRLGGDDPLKTRDIQHARIEALRRHLRDGASIDACLNWSELPPPSMMMGKSAKRCWKLVNTLLEPAQAD